MIRNYSTLDHECYSWAYSWLVSWAIALPTAILFSKLINFLLDRYFND
ncbi:hypothetical protein [Vibrio cholerae]